MERVQQSFQPVAEFIALDQNRDGFVTLNEIDADASA